MKGRVGSPLARTSPPRALLEKYKRKDPAGYADFDGDDAPINPAREARRRSAGPSFLVSLLQVPDGDVTQRKTLFSNEEMDAEGLERLVQELKTGPLTVTHDTWTDGEWEVRVRGPKGQLIHGYDSVGPDEIGGAKGQALMDLVSSIMSASASEEPPPMPEGELGAEPGAEPPPELLPGAPPAAAGAGASATAAPMPGAEMGGLPPAGPAAPSAAALTAGKRVLVVRKGQIADAVVMMVHPQQQALEVMFGGSGATETVPMHDVIDDGIELELEPEPEPFGDEGGGDDGGGGGGEGGEDGGGEDAIIEVSADDVAGPGGAGNDPFEVAVAPESEETPSAWLPSEREAMRYIASLYKDAVEFMGAFQPGSQLEAVRDFTSFYQGLNIPAGTELTVEGMHQAGQDSFFDLEGLPQVPGDQFKNVRVRLRTEGGGLVLITPEELEQQFEFARGDIPTKTKKRAPTPWEEDEQGWESMPGGYGVTVQPEAPPAAPAPTAPAPGGGTAVMRGPRPPPLPKRGPQQPPPLPKRQGPPPLPTGREDTRLYQTQIRRQ
ncbi:hypothetical protein Rctr197k_172 [Virus Rctr197k]|nr:hypothetical protein Rctr197k_172 [Virus Rctr197k]